MGIDSQKILHLKKLCVGADSLDDLTRWQKDRLARGARLYHVTRQTPKRADQILQSDGCLYWVIKGRFAARQQITDFEEVKPNAAFPHGGCRLVFAPNLQAVAPWPHRAFQGWRYLNGHEAPPPMRYQNADMQNLPDELQEFMDQIGLSAP